MKFIIKSLLITLFVIFAPLSIVLGKEVLIGGENIGIELDFEGILISGTYDVNIENGVYNPIKNDIRKGDYILKVDSRKIESSNDLISYFQNFNESKEVSLTLRRNDTLLKRDLYVYRKDNGWKTGLMIKDHILGIGTVTYYDPDTKTYAALGHEIADSSTGKIIKIEGGRVYESFVTGIKRSEDGSPGEKIASINKDEELGSINSNTSYGIYGYMSNFPINATSIETASMDDVVLGEAEIWTVLSNNRKEKYKIEIIDLKRQVSQDIKGLTFRITDERLLDKTNGIIQGMSGSPIVQNNKLIGAITHVIVSDVTSGYGVYIDWMLQETQKI